jgi:hypothetical protein
MSHLAVKCPACGAEPGKSCVVATLPGLIGHKLGPDDGEPAWMESRPANVHAERIGNAPTVIKMEPEGRII